MRCKYIDTRFTVVIEIETEIFAKYYPKGTNRIYCEIIVYNRLYYNSHLKGALSELSNWFSYRA